jgi:hypothetical protein
MASEFRSVAGPSACRSGVRLRPTSMHNSAWLRMRGVQSCDGCRRLLAQVNRPSALFSLSVSKISPTGSRTPQEASSDPTISSVNTRTIAGRSIASCLGHLLVSCDWRRYLGNIPGIASEAKGHSVGSTSLSPCSSWTMRVPAGDRGGGWSALHQQSVRGP